uniref:Uncharacterized protein n=1 Tax=Ditylenchus dipsaci TaxID=166011 RepID=A0A915D3Y6_9BILA
MCLQFGYQSGVKITCNMDNSFPLCALVDVLYEHDKEMAENCPNRCKRKRKFLIESLNVVYCMDNDYFSDLYTYHPYESSNYGEYPRYSTYPSSSGSHYALSQHIDDDIDEFPKLNIKNLGIYGCRKEMNISSTAFAALSGTLQKLTLTNLGLKGIPESVGNLTNLVKLELPNNNITRLAGSQLKKLKNLESLNVRKNKLNDVDGIFELSARNKLSALDLSYNELTNFATAKSLQNLTTLLLNNNKLKEIGSMMGLLKLAYIDLENNYLSSLPQYMFNANPSLNAIDLSSNQLVTIDQYVFVSLPNLTRLYLTNNSLVSVGNLLNEMPNLKILNLNANKLVDLTRSKFTNHKTTIDINLENNNITNISSDLFEGTPIDDLKLSYNQIQHANNITLYNTTQIDFIHLRGNNFVKECPKHSQYYIPLLLKLANGTETVVGSFSGSCRHFSSSSLAYYVSAAVRTSELPPSEEQLSSSSPAPTTTTTPPIQMDQSQAAFTTHQNIH